jgi:lysozyme family protein
MSNETRSEIRMLQADLNSYASAVGFEGVKIDGAVGPRTTEANGKVVTAVLAKNALLTPAFTYSSADDITKYVPQIRDWLSSTAAKTLAVSTHRLFKKGAGKDWNVKGDIAYGAGAVHDELMKLQRNLNKVAEPVGFAKLDVDGFVGDKTAAAIKKTYDKVVAKNAAFGVTLFPPPDTKEETAEFAQFINDWLENVASKQLVAEASA